MAKKQLEQLDTELTVLKHAALDQRMPKVRGAAPSTGSGGSGDEPSEK
jgi:hypothetical protein